MPSPLDLESLFAAIGLEPILRAKPTLHRYQLTEAAEYPKAIRRRVARFLATDAFAEGVDLPPFDFAETLDLVSKAETPDQAQSAALFAAAPEGELATDLGVQAGRIATWAKTAIPREEPEGLEPGEPTAGATADFRRAWQVAATPMVVLDDLEDGSLSDEQVSTLALLYPALYGEMRQAVSDARASLAGRRGKGWAPSPKKAKLLDLLMMTNPTDPGLAAMVQGIYANEAAQQQQPAPPSARRRRGSGEDLPGLTPGQSATEG